MQGLPQALSSAGFMIHQDGRELGARPPDPIWTTQLAERSTGVQDVLTGFGHATRLSCCLAVNTSQSVLSLAVHRTPVTGVCRLRRSCDGNHRTPLRGESERMREHSGHSTKATPLSANRLRSMATSPENGHLEALLDGTRASTVFVVFC